MGLKNAGGPMLKLVFAYVCVSVHSVNGPFMLSFSYAVIQCPPVPYTGNL